MGTLFRSSCTVLAAQGISSLRFDGANVADSPPMMGTSQQVLYDISQIIDVEDAVTLLKRYEPQAAILAVGRCSGAHLGFQAARQKRANFRASCGKPCGV